jgi:hypothetical protein
MKKGPLHQSMAEAVVPNLEVEGCAASVPVGGGRRGSGEESRSNGHWKINL